MSPAAQSMVRDRCFVVAPQRSSRVTVIPVPIPGNGGAPTARDRRTCAHLVERLSRLGAAAIVLHGAIPAGPAGDPSFEQADAELAAAIRRAGKVVLAARQFEGKLTSPVLGKAARAIAPLAVIEDADGLVRRAPLASPATGGEPHAALVVAGLLGSPAPGAVFGEPVLWRLTAPREVPFLAAVLDGHEAELAASVRGRVVLIALAERNDRYAICRAPGGGLRHVSHAQLTAAWVDAALDGDFVIPSSCRVRGTFVVSASAFGFLALASVVGASATRRRMPSG